MYLPSDQKVWEEIFHDRLIRRPKFWLPFDCYVNYYIEKAMREEADDGNKYIAHFFGVVRSDIAVTDRVVISRP